MKRRLVVRVVVDAFNDINLAAGRPIRSICPEGRPGTTASWHMNRVQNPQARVVGVVSGNADTLTVPGHYGRSLYSHDGCAIGCDLSEVVGGRSALVDVVDKSVRCDVSSVGESPAIKEIGSTMRFYQLPGSRNSDTGT